MFTADGSYSNNIKPIKTVERFTEINYLDTLSKNNAMICNGSQCVPINQDISVCVNGECLSLQNFINGVSNIPPIMNNIKDIILPLFVKTSMHTQSATVVAKTDPPPVVVAKTDLPVVVAKTDPPPVVVAKTDLPVVVAKTDPPPPVVVTNTTPSQQTQQQILNKFELIISNINTLNLLNKTILESLHSVNQKLNYPQYFLIAPPYIKIKLNVLIQKIQELPTKLETIKSSFTQYYQFLKESKVIVNLKDVPSNLISLIQLIPSQLTEINSLLSNLKNDLAEILQPNVIRVFNLTSLNGTTSNILLLTNSNVDSALQQAKNIELLVKNNFGSNK